jgi:hypothetical protein
MAKKKKKDRTYEQPAEEQPAEEEQPTEEEQPQEEPSEEDPSSEEEEQPQTDSEGIFEVDTGKKGKGKASINIEKFRELIDKVEAAMVNLNSNAVRISITEINKMLGTAVSNNNSFAYRLKTGRDTKPILEEHNLYIGSRGSWNGPVEDQKLAFVRTGGE